MEPRAAVARWEGDKLTVWAGTQRPFGIRTELAKHFRHAEANVRVIAPEIGGGFGTKSWYPAGLEAARLARLAGRPVRVAYTRQEDTLEGTFRPAALIDIKSGFRADGKITAWQFNAYHAGPFAFIGRRGSETPYDIENIAVTVYCAKSLIRVGSYRSLGAAANHFATESHVDEIAAAVGIDPVEIRLRNLSHPRFRRVLEAAADSFGWQSARAPSQRGVGVAIGTDVGSYVGTCLELKVEGREVKVQRVVTALDCGLTVNPEGARNQVEGSTVMGLGTALYEAIEVRNGVVLNTSLARYQVPRINNTPQIETLLVGDPETPSTGAGEPGIVTIGARHRQRGLRCDGPAPAGAASAASPRHLTRGGSGLDAAVKHAHAPVGAGDVEEDQAAVHGEVVHVPVLRRERSAQALAQVDERVKQG